MLMPNRIIDLTRLVLATRRYRDVSASGKRCLRRAEAESYCNPERVSFQTGTLDTLNGRTGVPPRAPN